MKAHHVLYTLLLLAIVASCLNAFRTRWTVEFPVDDGAVASKSLVCFRDGHKLECYDGPNYISWLVQRMNDQRDQNP